MLIEAPYKIGDTVTIKTAAGEEIIARLDSEEGSKLKIKKPMALTAANGGLGLVPWAFTVDQESIITLNTEAVMFIAKTESGMAKQYIESTTGITV